MPEPRVHEETPEDIRAAEEVEADLYFDRRGAAHNAGLELDRLMPTVQELLPESKTLVDVNPSASVVWSVLALEFFIKTGVLKPALRTRLGFDLSLTDQIFENLVGRNGSSEARKWLNRLFGVNFAESFMRTGHGNLWSRIWRESKDDAERDGSSVAIVDWRNRIIHKAYKASRDDARDALETVAAFVDHMYETLRGFRMQDPKD